MISLQTPVGRNGDNELLDLLGEYDDPATDVDAVDQTSTALKRLRPVDRALLVLVHRDGASIDDAAARLRTTRAAIVRRLRRCERMARGERKRRRSGVPAPLAGKAAPVGTIRVRRKSRQTSCRFIKVAEPSTWIAYARWLWERDRGPVPEGMQVLHRDGDSMNDDPQNLILGGHADRAFLFQSRSDANFRRSMSACRAGCRKHNVERAVARDLAGEIRGTKWYAIDVREKRIIGPFGRSVWMAYGTLGVATPPGRPNRGSWIAAQLGWSGLPPLDAAILHLLAERPATTAELVAGVPTLGALLAYRFSAIERTYQSRLWSLRNLGHVTSTRGQPHEITPSARAARQTPCLLAVLRGHECRSMQAAGYQVELPATP